MPENLPRRRRAGVNQIVAHGLELSNVEGFSDVAVGAFIPSGHAVGHIILGTEEDYGDMVGLDIAFEES